MLYFSPGYTSSCFAASAVPACRWSLRRSSRWANPEMVSGLQLRAEEGNIGRQRGDYERAQLISCQGQRERQKRSWNEITGPKSASGLSTISCSWRNFRGCKIDCFVTVQTRVIIKIVQCPQNSNPMLWPEDQCAPLWTLSRKRDG